MPRIKIHVVVDGPTVGDHRNVIVDTLDEAFALLDDQLDHDKQAHLELWDDEMFHRIDPDNIIHRPEQLTWAL